MNVILIHYFKADKERTRLCRSVKITGIAKLSLIQILLETVENVLHARIQLKLDMVLPVYVPDREKSKFFTGSDENVK